MSRALSLFTAVVLAISALSSAAPVDNTSLASSIENTVSSNITLEKRKKHHKKRKSSQKKSSKSKTTKKTTKKSSSSSSSSGTFKGIGTWFKPASEGGPEGACGPDENNNSMIVALNVPQYGSTSKKSSWCGKKIIIHGPLGTATATVNDACPGCERGSLDLTPALFEKVIGNMNLGVGAITWSLA